MNDEVPLSIKKLSLAVFFSIIFSICGLFVLLIVPHILNEFLEGFIKDPWYVATTPPYDLSYSQEYDAIVSFLKPIGYMCFSITILLILLGLILKRYRISLFGSYTLYIPLFGQFSYAMSALFAGIGVIRIIWMPISDIDSGLSNAAAVILFPYIFSLFFLRLVFRFEFGFYFYALALWANFIFMFALILVGLFIFGFSVSIWFYGKFQKKKIIDFWIYRYSRHPQYLGLILINYGLLFFPVLAMYIRVFIPTLPWLLVTLIIIGMAINEENKFLKEKNEGFTNWRNKTPFMIPLPKTIVSLILIPVRILFKKDWPNNNKEIVITLFFYGFIIIFLSIPFISLIGGD